MILIESQPLQIVGRADIQRGVRPIAGQESIREKPIAALQQNIPRLQLCVQLFKLGRLNQRRAARGSRIFMSPIQVEIADCVS